MTRLYRSTLLLLVLALAPRPVGAQPAGEAPWATATLAGWHDDVRLSVRDRRHAYGGLFFDRGVFRRLTPAMDHEYDMDLETYGFTASDEAAWYRSPHALHTFMGSIHRSRFATRTRFRHDVAVGARHTVLLGGMQQEDLTAQRFFVEIGYAYRVAPRHQVGFRQTVAAYKPDLDLSLFYGYEAPSGGTVRVELGLLDVANDLIFDVLGVDPVLEDTLRSYRRAPRLFEVQAQRAFGRGFRGEVIAGVQPATRADVRSNRLPDLRFRWDERLAYAGALVEYRHPRFTAGASYRHTFSRVARRAEPDTRDPADYASTQASHAAGLYALAPAGPLRAALWLSGERYTDVQRGTAFGPASIPAPLDYLERRLTLHAQLQRVPPRHGLRAGLDYLVDHRTFVRDADLMNRYLAFLPWSPNGRVALHLGYQFTPAVYLVAGASYDLGGDPFYTDGRGPTRYDGGFGRVYVTW